ncbi:MAG: hypothetical protein U0183_17160 [Polyangiaceae bacterium]|jgi:hypothetical protein
MPSATAAMFLGHARVEPFTHLLGLPLQTARKLLAEQTGHAEFELRSRSEKSKGVLPQSTVTITPYAGDLKRTDSLSFHLAIEMKLTPNGLDAKLETALCEIWQEIVAAFRGRPDFQARASVFPLKREVAAAAPALKALFKEAYVFRDGTLEHHASIQREKFFLYDVGVQFKARPTKE